MLAESEMFAEEKAATGDRIGSIPFGTAELYVASVKASPCPPTDRLNHRLISC